MGHIVKNVLSFSRLNTEMDELKRKIEQKEEEIILYKRKYEEASKQVANLVSGSRLFMFHF